MERDRERWDGRYADRPIAAASPPDAIADDAELLASFPTAGRAADIACGAGAQTLWLAARGLSIVALDVSPVAVELTERAADAAGVGARVDARVHDLDDGLPTDVADLDVLICQRFRAPRLYGPFVDALARGGVAVVTVLTAGGGGGKRPGSFRARPGELMAAFSTREVDVLHHREQSGDASIIVRRR